MGFAAISRAFIWLDIAKCDSLKCTEFTASPTAHKELGKLFLKERGKAAFRLSFDKTRR